MRCYLFRDGHIADVEVLEPGADAALIDQAKMHFAARSVEGFDGFEL